MAHDHDGNGGLLSTSLVNILNAIHLAIGRVEASQAANRQTVLDQAAATNLRIQDLKEEVFNRFIRVEARIDRIETARTGTPIPTSTEWLADLPWRLIGRFGGYILAGALMALAHAYVPEAKHILGFVMQQQR